jgi:rhomboid protease GluP
VAKKRKAILCGSCRQLISNQETKCPFCGAVQPDTFGAGEKLWALFRDDFDPVTIFYGVCGLAYVMTLMRDPGHAFNPDQLLDFGSPSSEALYLLGMTGGAAWTCGFVWTLLSASFLHGSLLHIIFNMSFLRSLGPPTVEMLGPARFVVLYLVSGAGGFLLSNVMGGYPTIGASASLFGILGGLAAFGWRRGGTIGANLQRGMLTNAAIIVAFTFMMGNVNHWGHLGGFLTGVGIAFVFPSHEGRHEGRGVQLLALGLMLATLASFFLSVWSMWDAVQHGGAVCH